MPKYEQDTARLVRDNGEEVTPGTVWETHHHGKPVKGKNGTPVDDRWEFKFISRLPEYGKSGKIYSERPCRHKDGEHPHYCRGIDVHEGYPPEGMKIVLDERFNSFTPDAIEGTLYLERLKDAWLLEIARDADGTGTQHRFAREFMNRISAYTNPSWITAQAAVVAYRRGLIDGEEFAAINGDGPDEDDERESNPWPVTDHNIV